MDRLHILDTIDLSHLRHTAENLKDQTLIVFEHLGIGLRKFKAVVTDNPSVVVKMRRLLSADYPHILDLRCFAHAINLLASGYLRHETAKSALKRSCRLVMYFRSSHFWNEKLESWQKTNKISHKARWYSVSKVLMSVHEYEPGFRFCVQKMLESPNSCPSIPRDVIDIINDSLHFGFIL